jgi:hypothetical protein
MLLTREEMTFDFGGATFDVDRDREVLAWIFNQFLYGEVTGIQVGHWIQEAPTLEAADFFAKQCLQELLHIKSFKRCFDILGVAPKPADRMVRMLSSDFIGGTFEEHVALEMAQGEGFVLLIFYALIDTIEHPEISKLLRRAAPQEEEHVAFGERETMRALARRPKLRKHLLGINLAGLSIAKRFTGTIDRFVPSDPNHPVLRQFPAFIKWGLDRAELRLRRLGLLDRPMAEMGRLRTFGTVAPAILRRYGRILWPFRRRKRLTETYLADPGMQPRPA